MMNLIQLLTDQRAYEGITHSLWGASWNWRWRCVGDDEDRRSPSPERETDSRSGLPMKNRGRRRLCLVKCDNSFFLIFSPRTRIYGVGVEVGGVSGGPRGRGARPGVQAPPHPRGQVEAPLTWILLPVFLIFSKNMFRGVSGHSENFCFCT